MTQSSDSRHTRQRKAAKILAILRDFVGDDLGNKTCLDIGCWVGIITEMLANEFRSVVGIDINFMSLRVQRSNLPLQQSDRFSPNNSSQNNRNNQALLAQADGKALPFLDEHFDVIVFAQVYEHVDDPATFVAEIQRALKPNGVVFFSGPNRWTLMEEHYQLPLLSWLPKGLADIYMRATGRGKTYDIRPLSYWQLKRLFHGFDIYGYTPKLLHNPKQFFVNERVLLKIPLWLGKLLSPLVPNFNWILTFKDPKGLESGTNSKSPHENLEIGPRNFHEETFRVSEIISDAYTQEYYLIECEGHEEFIATQGITLPQRLSRPLEIANVQPGQFVLDIGCGRGEITLRCAQNGAYTWGLDYAQEALKLTKRLPETSKMAYHQANALSLPFAANSFDSIFMLDVVEHLTPEALRASLAEGNRVLKPGGRLIVHTMPNLWYYRFGYPLFRLVQRLRGQEIPKDPRSRWGFAHLHVNEQNPLKLWKTLQASHFHTKIWLESTQNYIQEPNRLVRSIMKSLTVIPPFKWIFCNDIFAIGTKSNSIRKAGMHE